MAEVEILTFSNAGDTIGRILKFMKDNGGRMPTPAEAGLDNVKIAPDGLTNYTWAMREAHIALGYVSVADLEKISGKPVV